LFHFFSPFSKRELNLLKTKDPTGMDLPGTWILAAAGRTLSAWSFNGLQAKSPRDGGREVRGPNAGPSFSFWTGSVTQLE
jgi:hypothetical protein